MKKNDKDFEKDALANREPVKIRKDGEKEFSRSGG